MVDDSVHGEFSSQNVHSGASVKPFAAPQIERLRSLAELTQQTTNQPWDESLNPVTYDTGRALS